LKCNICNINSGTFVEFLKGGKCGSCGLITIPKPVLIYKRDEVDSSGRLWHIFKQTDPMVCKCGHIGGGISKKLCKEANGKSLNVEKEMTYA
jgi:hypothetical protein